MVFFLSLCINGIEVPSLMSFDDMSQENGDNSPIKAYLCFSKNQGILNEVKIMQCLLMLYLNSFILSWL